MNLEIRITYVEITKLKHNNMYAELHDDLRTIVNGDGVHGRASTVGGHYSDGVLGIVGDIGDDYASG